MNVPPRYMPGAAPSYGPAQYPADQSRLPRRGTGQHAAAMGRRPPGGGKARRTDPTMYEWDRLSPEQQQAVLDTIGSARQAKGGIQQKILLIGLLVIIALGLVVIAAILLHR